MRIEDLNSAGIVGAGTMGGEIGLIFALAGLRVTLYDLSPSVLESTRKRLAQSAKNYLALEWVTPEAVDRAWARMSYTTSLGDLADVDLISESVFEELEIKRQVWEQLARTCAERTVFTTNTSSLRPSEFATATGRPDRFAAMHFHLPILGSRIVDVMNHGQTSPATMDLVEAFVEKTGLIPIRIEKESPRYVFNAMLIAFVSEAAKLLANEIASKEDIDLAWTSIMGTPAGPFAIMDHVGIDTAWRIVHGIAEQENDSDLRKAAGMLKSLVDEGHLGVKTGQGFYSHPQPD